MGKIRNVNLIAIFAIMFVGLGAIGCFYAIDAEKQVVLASPSKTWNVSFDKDNYSAYGYAKDYSGPIINTNSVEFNMNFTNPGDYKTYTFEVLNNGDVNAILKSIKVIADEGNPEDVTFEYSIYKGDNILTNSHSTTIDSGYNHLYKHGGSNLVEVTVKYEPANNVSIGTVFASYELKLTYEQE